MAAASLHAVHANESHGLWARATDPVAQMVPAPLGLPCRKRPPAFRSPPSGRDAVATLVPAASPAGRTGKHGFRSQIGRAHVELQSLMRISYAVFCLKKKKKIVY